MEIRIEYYIMQQCGDCWFLPLKKKRHQSKYVWTNEASCICTSTLLSQRGKQELKWATFSSLLLDLAAAIVVVERGGA